MGYLDESGTPTNKLQKKIDDDSLGSGNLKEQVRTRTDHPETLVPDRLNEDRIHDIEASLKNFLDRPLALDQAIELSAQALDLDLEKVAQALDGLVASGAFIFKHGMVVRADNTEWIEDEYNLRLGPDADDGSSSQAPLSSRAENEDEDAYAMAEAEAQKLHNCNLDMLSLEEQSELLQDAESKLYATADMDNPPAPDPQDGVDAQTDWEEVTNSDGSKIWRDKNNPNVTVRRPGNGGAAGA